MTDRGCIDPKGKASELVCTFFWLWLITFIFRSASQVNLGPSNASTFVSSSAGISDSMEGICSRNKLAASVVSPLA